MLEDLDRAIAAARSSLPEDEVARTDLLHDLEEMKLSMNVGAYRGCLAMAGRILEAVLKLTLRKAGRRVEKDWMVGKLLAELDETAVYVDPGAKNIWNLINLQRIVGVHAKEMVPIPSREQAVMVVYAVIDTLTRRLDA